MKAVGFRQSLPITERDSLLDIELPDPVPEPRDLLVEVKAVSVNPVDTKIRMNAGTNLPQPRILGWDCAGVVEAVGEDCSLFKPGDAVFYAGDVTRAGCNGQYHLIDERIVGRKPASLSFDDAAAMPLTTITAWEALFDRMSISKDAAANKGKSILIIGAAGGVGSIAVQLAKKVAGLQVIATASRAQTEQWCRDLGADQVINHREALGAEAFRLLLGLAGTLVFYGVPLDVSLLGAHLDVDGARLAERGADLDLGLHLALQRDLVGGLAGLLVLAVGAAQEAEQRGRRGEALAAWYLWACGWRILAKRQRVGVGEVTDEVRPVPTDELDLAGPAAAQGDDPPGKLRTKPAKSK